MEKHLKDTKSTLEAAITEPKNQTEIDFSTTASPWWNQIAGTFADNSAYDESIRLGREYRGSLRGSGVLGEE
ncbi:MAG: hypothetical protein HC886_09105 [Leptolyngbyaceae cyanobacterium SM1_1_3]|nr:hypothetical protein [Leptolyngbyaceae cyanobacterium SM1_1_3]NJM84777.1 hypothetical protein [Leptolyngbyaceae cyanobacterium RM2_2_21]NJN04453.1 hypothetical protein [Leptolyngbyaceae cyanobacterium RM1_1_2]NJO10060.1 hypothetical protein [Leptolyngbyaceae cyanobacterium SL_1_1]